MRSRASRLSSCHVVSSCVSACRLVWAPFRSAVRSFVSFAGAVLPCVPVPSRFALGIPLVLRPSPSLRPVGSARSHLLSRSVSSVGGSCPFSCLFPVFAPFRSARRSFLSVNRSQFVLFSSPSWGVAGRHGHGAGACCSYRLIRPILLLLATHSLVAGWRREDEVMGHRFMLLAARSFSAHVPSFFFITSDPRPHCVLSSPHPRSKKSGNGDGGEVG